MREFALLLDSLSNTPSRNGKLTLLRNYFRASPDPDRGFALAALTDEMPVSIPLRRVLTELSASRFDPVLFKFSRDYVGDTAETLSLLWPDAQRKGPPLRLGEIVEVVKLTSGQRIAEQIAGWLDGMDTNERWALLKFLSGALRVGVSARLAKLSIAKAFDHKPEEIEELWHGLRAPYLELFQWLEGKAPRPLSADDTALLYRRLHPYDSALPPLAPERPAQAPRVQLGQPVPCGSRDGVPVSALRICASARWVADAAGSPQGTGHAVRQAMLAFDRLAQLARQLDGDDTATACEGPGNAWMAA